MPNPQGERQLSSRRVTEYRCALGWQRDSETRPGPSADVLDEELLVCREPFGVKDRRVFMKPRHLFGQPVHTDDHRGRYVGRFEEGAPLRDPLAVACKYDCLGRIRRDVHRDQTTSVVVEKRLGDELSRDGVSRGRFRRWFGTACAADCLVIHCRTPFRSQPTSESVSFQVPYWKNPRPDFRPKRPASTMRAKSGGGANRDSLNSS